MQGLEAEKSPIENHDFQDQFMSFSMFRFQLLAFGCVYTHTFKGLLIQPRSNILVSFLTPSIGILMKGIVT